jgi:hypothetical protein
MFRLDSGLLHALGDTARSQDGGRGVEIQALKAQGVEQGYECCLFQVPALEHPTMPGAGDGERYPRGLDVDK